MLETSIDYAVGGANTDFVLNGINYLSQQESKISIRAKDLSVDTAIVPAFSQQSDAGRLRVRTACPAPCCRYCYGNTQTETVRGEI